MEDKRFLTILYKIPLYLELSLIHISGDMADSLPVLVNLVANAMPFRKGIAITCDSQTVINDKKVTEDVYKRQEWGGMGQNYLRSLLALGFQAFLIIVCVAIYAVLVQNIALEDDIIMAIWSCVGYTVLLCFTLFKTGSLAKSVFQAH